MAFVATLTGTGRNCTLTSGQPTMTVSSNTGLVVGATIQGTGIPTGTKITIINGNNITMSANATTGGTQSLIFSSVFGSVLTIVLNASGDVATWQNVFNAGFGIMQGTKNLFFSGALQVNFGSIVAGATFNHQDWTVEWGDTGRVQFDSGLLAGTHLGGYDTAGSLQVRGAGPTFIFSPGASLPAGGYSLFANTGNLLTQGGTFRMHNLRIITRAGSSANRSPSFTSVRDFMDVENLILDYSEATGTNASIGCGYGTILNPKIIQGNSGLARTNANSVGNIIGLQFLGIFTDSPNAKFAIPHNYVMEEYTPQVTNAQTIGGFQSNSTETFANINLSAPGWGLNDLKTKYFRYGGTNIINFPRRVSFDINDSTGANLTGVTLFIRSGENIVLNAVQAGDYSANTQALVLTWNTAISSYRVANIILDTINQIAQIRKYGFIEQSTSYSLNNNTYSQPFFMLADTSLNGISEATAAAISTVGINWATKTIKPTANLTYDQINARIAWELAQTANSAQTDPRSVVGKRMTLATGWSLIVNNGITITSGTNIDFIQIPTVTLNGTGKIEAIYGTSAGTSTALELRSISNNSVYLVADDTTKNTILYGVNNTGANQNYKVYFPPGSNGTKILVAREKYGFQRRADVITLSTGEMWYTFIDIEDVAIASPLATVQSYTVLDTSRKLYDYTAYRRLEEKFIKLGQICNRGGSNIELDSNLSMIVNKDATQILDIVNNVLTIKTTALAGDTFFGKIVAFGTNTITRASNEIITINIEDANGDSSINIQGGSGSYEVWKVANGTSEDDYTSGTKLADTGLGIYRFLGTIGFYILVRDKTKNNRDTCSMLKGNYDIGLYSGSSQIQLAQAPLVVDNNAILKELVVKLGVINQGVKNSSLFIPHKTDI
jgi:hypothetical protein